MGKKKALNWLVVFAGLGAFTATTVAGAFADPNVALAKGADSDLGLRHGSKIVVLGEDKADKEEGKLIKRLGRMRDRGVVCEIGQAQYEALSQKFDTSIETVALDDKTVDVARVTGRGVSANDVLTTISEDGERPDCRPVRMHRAFYLLFNANMS